MPLHLITVTHLVEAVDSDIANASIAQSVAACHGLVDCEISRTKSTADQLQQMREQGLYQAGDAFSNWFIFSRSEFLADDKDPGGFWSNDYGWTTLSLATPFSAEERLNMPVTRDNDATLVPKRQAIEIQANGR